MDNTKLLADFLAEVVMTGYYLADPPKNHQEHLHDVEAKCLKVIYAFQPINIQEIARLLHTTKPRATQLVHSLEKRNLVIRKPGTDHRVVLISTSQKGSKVVEELREKYVKLATSINNKIGEERSTELCKILSEINPLAYMVIDKKEV